jgi:hypothetical protein
VKPSPNAAGYGVRDVLWTARIGKFIGDGDHWWLLDSEGEWRAETVEEVYEAIVLHGLPAMKARI